MKKFMLFVMITIVTGGHVFARGASEIIEHYTRPENASLGLPFSEAVRIGSTVYLAGQIGVKAGESEVVPGGIKPESKQTLENIKAVLRHFNLTMDDVFKCQVMLLDISEWPAFNKVYKTFFNSPYPARSAFAGSGLALDARVEVDCLATIKRPGSEQ